MHPLNQCCICQKPIAVGDQVTAYTSGEVAHDDCYENSIEGGDIMGQYEVLKLHD